MSIIPSFFLFLLYFISMHACEARYNIGFGHKGFGAPPQHSGKGLFQLVVEKLRLGILDASSKGISVQVIKKEDDHGTHIFTSQDTKEYSLRTTHHDVKGVIKYSSRSGGGQKTGVVSVSWSVPHKINRDKNSPGFYSDYSRPRTRPPSHN